MNELDASTARRHAVSAMVQTARENAKIFAVGCVLHSAGRLIKTLSSGLLISLIVSQFIESAGLPLPLSLEKPLLLIIAGVLIALLYPLGVTSEYVSRRIVLHAERRSITDEKQQKVSFYWSSFATLSGIVSAAGFSAVAIFMAPIATIAVLLIAAVGYAIFRVEHLILAQTGANLQRAVFESVGRMNLIGEVLTGVALIAVLAMSTSSLFFPAQFSSHVLLYLFVIRSLLASIQSAAVSFQRVFALSSKGGALLED